jgi:polar amino acid transport system ATP-binding protein
LSSAGKGGGSGADAAGGFGAGSGNPVLELRGVTKAYGEVAVLRGIDLVLHEHRAVALIGASGSGKSTLMRCVDLLEEIDDGDILLDGEPMTVPGLNPVRFRRRLGFVFQAYNLFPHMDVLSNVVLGAVKGAGMSRASARSRGLELLERFGLGDRGDDYPDRLSGGQQQRVAIVRALLTRPRALLLDEVTSALDPELVGEVLGVIRELKDEGMTMLIATHEMSFARDVADEVCYLQDGRILERGRPEQIFTEPREPATQRFLARLLQAR